MIGYRTCYFDLIVKTNIIKETDKSVTFKDVNKSLGYCYHKRNNHMEFFKTFEEAKKAIEFEIDGEIADLKDKIIELLEKKEKLDGITEENCK